MPAGGRESTSKMGNTSRSQVLEGRDIASVAKYIKSDKCRNIAFMLGAGVSTSAGIPDFRSPNTGLYANLKNLGLPTPEAVFDIGYFEYDPKPFYTLAHDLQPGKFRPTLTHSFVRLIHEKDLLLACFTQNIDTLERRAGVPESKLIEAHGSFATHHCIKCRAEYDHESMMDAVEQKKIPRCRKCQGYVKPDIVFFGEALPNKFWTSRSCLEDADLLIIAGTSLTVQPFAGLAHRTSKSCPRVLINLEKVGNLGSNPDDVLLLGQCDAMVEDLSKELGWHDELLELWDATQLTTAQPKTVKPAEDEVKELAQLLKKVRLGEDGEEQKAPVPDTNPTDPTKPSITSGDKVESNPETASKETSDHADPTKPSIRSGDEDDPKSVGTTSEEIPDQDTNPTGSFEPTTVHITSSALELGETN